MVGERHRLDLRNGQVFSSDMSVANAFAAADFDLSFLALQVTALL